MCHHKPIQHIFKLISFYIYNKRNGSNGIAPLRDNEGAALVSNSDKATLLNKYVSNVFTKDNGIIDNA